MDKLTKYNILYVDDEESNLRVFNGLYRRKYNIVTSTSAEEALVLFDQRDFDLVISDQQMPKVSGLEFLGIIKEKNPQIPTILLTGYTDHDVLKEAFNKTGVHKYINKPFDPNSLSTIMNLAIEGYLLTKEKQQIQEELFKSEDQFRGIFNSMADVFARTNFSGEIEVMSPSSIDLFGYTAEELIGQDVDILYANPEERKALISKLKKLRIIRGAETTIVTKSGELKLVSITAKLYFDKENNPIGIESISRDISEIKEMQQLLKERNELLNETQRLAKIGSWHYDIATKKVSWSDTFSLIYGIHDFNQIDTTIDGYIAFFHPSEQQRVKETILKALETHENFSFDATILRRDGKERMLSNFVKLETNEENRLIRVTVASLDITETKIRQKELIKSEEKFRVLAEELPIQILKIDRKLNVTYANNLAKTNLSSLKDEKLTIHSFFHKETLLVLLESIQNVMNREKESYVEFESKDKWYALNISLSKEPRGIDNMLLLIYDITEKKQSERVLKNMNEELERKVIARTKDLEEAKDTIELAYKKEKELSQLKSQFVSTASHQFRTPLTVIQSNIGLLGMQIDEAGPEFKIKFDRVYPRIISEVKRMTDLMDNVLILGKKESGKIKPNFQMIDIQSMVQSILQKYNEIQMDGREIVLTSSGPVSMYHIDPELFENAFSNLISNAFKYSQSKPAPLVHLKYKKGLLTITVQDFGIGIPKEDISHVFEPFYRAGNVSDISGTGLGTSIVMTYLELMDVSIDIESELGKGTKFTINIEK